MKTDEMGVLWGRGNELIVEVEMTFPKNNLILRDVDGQPIYLKDYHPLGEGDFISTLE